MVKRESRARGTGSSSRAARWAARAIPSSTSARSRGSCAPTRAAISPGTRSWPTAARSCGHERSAGPRAGDVSQADRSGLAEWFRLEAAGLEQIGSPFYGELERRLADDVETGGPAWTVLESRAGSAADDALALRLFGGVHRMVLAGTAPAVARHYASAGGDGDAEAAWFQVRDLLARPPAAVLDALTRPPQTNEVGRSASLVPGFLLVAAESGLPLRLLELGSSAGLNL